MINALTMTVQRFLMCVPVVISFPFRALGSEAVFSLVYRRFWRFQFLCCRLNRIINDIR
jgi:hypothetical protein